MRNSLRLLLINPSNEILLMCADDPSTTSMDETYNRTFWFPVGGQIEEGETLIDTARRELEEETQMSPDLVSWGPVVWLEKVEIILSGVPTVINHQFMVGHTSQTEISLEGLTESEQKVITQIKWFSVEEIKSCNQVVYPIDLLDHLPAILAGEYPSEPIWVGDNKPKNKP